MLWGTAVGDAVGLPAEGLSKTRARKWFHGVWRHRLLFGHGMVSDDTDHTVMTAQAILRFPDSPERFARRLSLGLIGWLLSLPPGIGLATLRAILKLLIGVPPRLSGVASAGNGPAMRSAPMGAAFDGDATLRRAYVTAAT